MLTKNIAVEENDAHMSSYAYHRTDRDLLCVYSSICIMYMEFG